MCGIFAQTGLVNTEQALKAAALFSYRGPNGTHYDDVDGVTLVQHRLAILDTRTVADQPLWNGDRTIGAIFNGEIYNFSELRKVHFPATTVWQTEGDTEVIIRLYEKYGESFTQYLDGMYAIVLLDRKKNTLLAFRDMFGIKPLYYAVTGHGFVCASEVKGVVAALRQAGAPVTPQGGFIDFYMTFGYIPSPRTAVAEVSAVMPGSFLSFDLKKRTLSQNKSSSYDILEDEQGMSLAEITERSVIRNMVADVPVGIFLSGGTDSTFIAHVLGEGGFNALAFTMEIPGRYDADFARKVALRYGLKQEIIQFTPELFEQAYATMRERLDLPTTASSLIPTLALSEVASQQVSVLLSGEGGDEVFMGYPRHLRLAQMHANREWFSSVVGMSIPRRFKESVLYHVDNAVAYYAMASGLVPNTAGIEHMADIVRQRGTAPVDLDLEYYLENVLLPKIDMGTMYSSIEGRVPFCSPPVLAAARKSGIGVLQRERVPKAPLKEYLARHLPNDIVFRKKSGFSIPFLHYSQSSALVQEDIRALNLFLKERFPERTLQLIAAANQNQYALYALLALMHTYRNLNL
jgi:asparagine synthase (glutamine-hydrolysing)